MVKLTAMRERLTDYREDWDAVVLWAAEDVDAARWEPVILRIDRAALEQLEGQAGLKPGQLAAAADRHATALLAVAAAKLPFTDRAETIRIGADDLGRQSPGA